MILKSGSNSKNRITAINMLAISVIIYRFNIIDCNLSEVKSSDIQVRRMMTTHNMHQPKADNYYLYLPRSISGGGGEGGYDPTRTVL